MEYWESVWRGESRRECEDYAKGWAASCPPFVEAFRAVGAVRVCDAGCGFGAMSAVLLKNGFCVEGFDISPSAVELTCAVRASLGFDAGEYAVADMRELPYESGRFDALAAHSLIDHVCASDAKKALLEMLRVTRKGGLVYLSFDGLEADDAAAPHETLSDGSFVYKGGERDGMLFRYYRDADIDALLKDLETVWRSGNEGARREIIVKAK